MARIPVALAATAAGLLAGSVILSNLGPATTPEPTTPAPTPSSTPQPQPTKPTKPTKPAKPKVTQTPEARR